MKKLNRWIVLLTTVLLLSGCALFQDLLSGTKKDGKTSKKPDNKKTEDTSPPVKTEVLCTYFHYFRSDDFAQWWIPSKDPNTILGPESWRRDLWLGRVGDYPYIGAYDNVRNADVVRWHIRLAKAAGISAFLIYMNDWENEAPQTQLLLDVAAEEDFKIGFVEQHSALGGAPRRIFDGHPQPILPRQYLNYEEMTRYNLERLGLPLPPEQAQSPAARSRRYRDVPADALNQAIERISGMLQRWVSHPAYLRIDGKPIIMVPYMDKNITAQQFKSLVDTVEANVHEDLYVVAIIPQVYWYYFPPAVSGTGITQDWAASGADAFTHWTPNGMLTTDQKMRLKATAFNTKNSKQWKKDAIIPIMPGFDDDAWRPGNDPAPSFPADEGRAWSAQIDAALAAKPRFIYIQCWNEWHEGAQIEPSTLYSDPYLYLRILAEKLKKPWQAPALPPQSSIDQLRVPYLPY